MAHNVTRLTRRKTSLVLEDIDRYMELSARKTKIEAEMKETGARLCADGNYEDDAFRVTIVKNDGRATINKDLLVKQGVSPKVIEKATKYSDPFQFPRITDKAAAAEKSAETKAARGEEPRDRSRGRDARRAG